MRVNDTPNPHTQIPLTQIPLTRIPLTQNRLSQTSNTELVDALTAAETHFRRTYSRMLDFVSELDSRGVASGLGYPTTAALLVDTLRISHTDARHRLAQAAALRTRRPDAVSGTARQVPLAGGHRRSSVTG
jgi:hypothetical protein